MKRTHFDPKSGQTLLLDIADVIKVVGRDKKGNLLLSCPPEWEYLLLGTIEHDL